MLGERLRMLLNPVNGTLNFPLHVSAEPRALLLIVRDCRAEFRPRIGTTNERLHANWARFSAHTCAAGVPTTLPL
jgi:hypothetical protein